MKHVHVVTGSCPETEYEVRERMADIREAEGDHEAAADWRALLVGWREDWADPEKARVKVALGFLHGPDPDALLTPMPTPEHPMYWHDTRAAGVLCPCGHFGDFLCDEPVGNGKTCDQVSCKCCRVEIIPGVDHCAFHALTKPREAATPALSTEETL